MNDQRGPRAGWTFGGLGALSWMVALGLVLLAKGIYAGGAVAIGFFGLGVVYLTVLAPWKHARVPLWRIYVGLVGIIIAAAALISYLWYTAEARGGSGERFPWISLLALFGLLPLFIPVFIFGGKTWHDLHRR